MSQYEAEFRRRLMNVVEEGDINEFALTILWFITHTFGRDDLSPYEEMIWDRIIEATVRYWDPTSFGCPI